MDKWLVRILSKEQFIWIGIVLVDLILVFLNQSTYDNGDSILHFLQAQEAWSTPVYFMDMWAKPIFVLCASPLASLGWWGMKLFNTICILYSSLLAKKIFEYFNLNGWWAVFLCFFAFSFFLVQSSGLTEPLFTVCLTAIIYLYLIDKDITATVLLSFLPFIRSEGYVVTVIFLCYLLFAKKIRIIPLLLVGTVIYGVSGLFVCQDFLWMFHQNPYTGIEAKYGRGDVWHYVVQLPYLTGLPIFILFALGVFKGGIDFFGGKLAIKPFFLVYGICLGYIAAHTIFWRYGMFHSFGLTRVLLVLIPLIAFISYKGLEWLICAFSFLKPQYIRGIVIITIVIFPFINNKMALDWEHDFSLNHEQELIQVASAYINENNLSVHPLYTNAYFYALDSKRRLDNKHDVLQFSLLKKSQTLPQSKSLLLWDSSFALSDTEISKDYITSNYSIRTLKTFKNNQGYELVIYQVL